MNKNLSACLFIWASLSAQEESRGMQERALILIATAEKAMVREDYARAKNLLYELASWPLDSTQIIFRLGVDLIKIGEFNTSATLLKKLLRHDPSNVNILYNIGFALKNEGRMDEALSYYKKALARNAQHDATHLALGYALLNKGDFTQGWQQHERYLQRAGKYAPELRTLLENDSLKGKRILLTPEGGLGDTIHFMQAAHLLKEHGAYVIAAVQKPLLKLLQNCTCVDEVISGIPLSLNYDARVTFMSLPAALYLTEETMPKKTPYLFADPELITWWQNEINMTTAIKIGICWQADLPHDESRLPVARRSIPLESIARLADIPGVSLYSLQMHEHNAACHAPAVEEKIRTFEYAIDTEHGPFMDTAAIITCMDIIISVDTATAHLAAALGKPTWLLLPYATDWRWIAHRTDSPWHPTMHIFKQHHPFDWTTVIEEVTKALQQLN